MTGSWPVCGFGPKHPANQDSFFVDLYQHLKDKGGVDLDAYGEWYSVLSLKKTTGLDVALPGIRDVGVSLGVNAGSKPARDPALYFS